MANLPSRRVFSFSLRSLLVVITLVCVWLAWESSIVRQRQRMLGELRASHAFQITTAKNWAESFPAGNAPQPAARIPWLRRLLGDEAIQEVGYFRHMVGPTTPSVERVAKLFPEAKVQETMLYEPCHPGCFPRGTLVETPSGRRAIETIAAGDEVVAYRQTGEPFTARVQSIFRTENRLWRVTTEAGELMTTETQPLCLASGEDGAAYQTRQAGELQAGDAIYKREAGELRAVKVLAVARTSRVENVVNLVLGDCEAFVANEYLARSKPPIQSAEANGR
jgi:hypothetical protein